MRFQKRGGRLQGVEDEVPSEYIGRMTTQPKGSPASILAATLSANSTGIKWLACPATMPPCIREFLNHAYIPGLMLAEQALPQCLHALPTR